MLLYSTLEHNLLITNTMGHNSAAKARTKHAKKNTKKGKALAKRTRRLRK